MNENLKVAGVIIILSVIVSVGLTLTIKHYEKPYKVQIEFCDGRPFAAGVSCDVNVTVIITGHP